MRASDPAHIVEAKTRKSAPRHVAELDAHQLRGEEGNTVELAWVKREVASAGKEGQKERDQKLRKDSLGREKVSIPDQVIR